MGCLSTGHASINCTPSITVPVRTESDILTKASPETPSKSDLSWNMDTAKTINQSYDAHCLMDFEWDGRLMSCSHRRCYGSESI